ncbi:MAG: class I SAM-dependent methyltransferase [Chloroflexota bacterium]
MITPAAAPDLAAVKARQQATWSSGDYHAIGVRIVLVAEELIESLDLRSTETVLDVATGSGNAALAAARRGAEVTGADYVPALLERARRRADAESLEATFVPGDAEALPFEDGAFDVTASVFGAMFAPDQARTASELARVTRSGGRIGLVAHTPEGFIGNLFRTVGRHVPPPAGVASPALWGTEARLGELFGPKAARMTSKRKMMVFRYASPMDWVDEFRELYGPVRMAFRAVGPDGAGALEADLLDLVARFNASGDETMVVPSEYLETVIVRA